MRGLQESEGVELEERKREESKRVRENRRLNWFQSRIVSVSGRL
jgi:hypothetical protein